MSAMLNRISSKDWLRPRYNVRLRTRDPKGRIVEEYKGHNIYLNVGREWLLQHMTYQTYPAVVGNPPPPTNHERRIAFMGLGVGGREQSDQPGALAIEPTATFTFDDTDVTITGLETPVLWAPAKYAKEIILAEPSAPVGPPPGFSVWMRYTAIWEAGDINNAYGGLPVPISEAAIYPLLLDGGGLVQEMLQADMTTRAAAYECFRAVTKPTDFQLEAQWTFRM